MNKKIKKGLFDLKGYATIHDPITFLPSVKEINILCATWSMSNWFIYRIEEIRSVSKRNFFQNTKIRTKTTLVLTEIESGLFVEENSRGMVLRVYISKKTLNKLLFYLNSKIHIKLPRIEVSKF